jgi:PHD-finger
MNSMVHNSIVSRDDIPIICKETLESIGNLDLSLTELCTKIDEAVGTLQSDPKTTNKKSNASSSSSSSSSSNKRKATSLPSSSASSSLIDDINTYKDMIENVSARKVTLATRAYDFLDHAVKCVDEDIRIIERAMKLNGYEIPVAEDSEDGPLGKKSQNKELEPLYCTCRSIAHGDMISCDNEKCNIEWFHFACVGLTKLPKGDWFCKACKNSLNRHN